MRSRTEHVWQEGPKPQPFGESTECIQRTAFPNRMPSIWMCVYNSGLMGISLCEASFGVGLNLDL